MKIRAMLQALMW